MFTVTWKNQGSYNTHILKRIGKTRRTNMQQNSNSKDFLKSELMFFILRLYYTPKHWQILPVKESRHLRSFENKELKLE